MFRNKYCDSINVFLLAMVRPERLHWCLLKNCLLSSDHYQASLFKMWITGSIPDLFQIC